MSATLAQVEALRAGLMWALNYIEGGADPLNNELPRHDCGYITAPETGYCEFHERYIDAYAALADVPRAATASRG